MIVRYKFKVIFLVVVECIDHMSGLSTRTTHVAAVQLIRGIQMPVLYTIKCVLYILCARTH